MASTSISVNPRRSYNHFTKGGGASFNENRLCSFTFQSGLLGSKIPMDKLSLSVNGTRPTRPEPIRFSCSESMKASSRSFDVVIVGAGIIGLTIARQFLTKSNLSVAVVDKAVPCSGATGAGQGYIWMVHKNPASDTWELTKRSHQLWKKLAETIRDQGMDSLQVLGWKKTGSLLVGRTPEDSVMLRKKVSQLSEAGLRAEYLSSDELHSKEPSIYVGTDGGAAFAPEDCQLDAHLAVSYIEKVNRSFAPKGRYAEFYHEPVTGLVRSTSSGEYEAVRTSNNTLYGKAIIVAAGCWSRSLMHDLLKDSNVKFDALVMPRKGHLLVIENFNPLQLNHGSMEVGYIDYQNAAFTSGQNDQSQTLSVSMTSTIDTVGNLVLGSSRQFAGFSTEVDDSIVLHIWKRAGEFFPKLKELPLTDFVKNRKVRVGLRPYMPDGKPVIGPVPGLSNLFFATGHEGGGLSMALGTAEMVVDMVLGNPTYIDNSPFAAKGRCC
ncbi:putative lipoxygenase [Hibiscus syriacus]|uniref:FAD-dependent oxidoreductase domain-containing protein 1 n=2 Tax=Hibiscus syriacus TaxID=106335 RepID=A0A6A2WQK9_HIBSY|nr:glycine oxidase-like isoform X1 [Hibiscus syriacus]KAE8663242.1 putative lipoxygenase [Hibiscus syriacus]